VAPRLAVRILLAAIDVAALVLESVPEWGELKGTV
jgi:hypothetical protein